MTKREIGYYHGIYNGHASATVHALGDVTEEEAQRVAVGLGIAIGLHTVIAVVGRGSYRAISTYEYRGLGGGALREARERSSDILRDCAKEAIRAAGFKPVRL